MAAQNTPFLPGFELRLTYTGIQILCREFNIETVDELPELITTGKLKTPDFEKIIWIGLLAKHPDMTIEELRKPGGLFDKFLDPDGNKGLNDLVSVGMQCLFDSGILTSENPGQVADKGEEKPEQLKNG